MSTRFFRPFVGSHYQEGIQGKRVLILGASFYCPQTDCAFFHICTDVIKKDSSPCDKSCPIYKSEGKTLHDEPTYCIGDAPRTYQTFASYISKFVGTDDYDKVWSHLAFTNYVQFFLPAASKGFRETRWSDMSERDFESFIQTIEEIQPDIVIIWGCVINSRLKEDNEYVVDKQSLASTGGYLCHMYVPGMSKLVTLLNPYHPSSSVWHSDLSTFDN